MTVPQKQLFEADKFELSVAPRPQRFIRAWPLSAALAIFVVNSLIWIIWFAISALNPMGSGFNVAVAEFTEIDESGRVFQSQIGENVSEVFFEALETRTDLLPSALQANLRGPKDVGIIPGNTSETRTSNAADTAQRLNATILISGIVLLNNNGGQVVPEFYVGDQSFNYGSEILDPERLSTPIDFDDSSAFEQVNLQLTNRVQTLLDVVNGLAFYFIGQYDQAATQFRAALNTTQPEDGQEVIYVLLGHSILQGYDTNPTEETLAEARSAFERALQIDPAYGRSYSGLAAVSLREVTTASVTSIEEKLAMLDMAESFLTVALESSDQETTAFEVELVYYLGQTHLLRFELSSQRDAFDQAQDAFENVIAKYEAANEPPDLALFAEQSHANLGRLAGLNSDWSAMLMHLQQAISILENTSATNSRRVWAARYWSQIGFAQTNLGQIDNAIAAYEEAIRLGNNDASLPEVDVWQTALDELQKLNDRER